MVYQAVSMASSDRKTLLMYRGFGYLAIWVVSVRLKMQHRLAPMGLVTQRSMFYVLILPNPTAGFTSVNR